MNLTLTEEQEMLRRTTRELLERECPRSLVREMESDKVGMASNLWKQMADVGLMGIPFPETYGGVGGSFLDLAIAMEEIGRALVPGPFLQTVVSCGMAILEFGTDSQRQAFIPNIATGATAMALATLEPGAPPESLAISTYSMPSKEGYVITGTKVFVPFAPMADYFLVSAREGHSDRPESGINVFLVDSRSSGVETEVLQTRAKNQQYEVRFVGTTVPAENLLGEPGQGYSILQRIRMVSAAAQSSEAVGMCAAVTDMAVEYAKGRTQFGRPVGTFQHVQRHCTDMFADTEGARYLAYEAAWRIAEGLSSDIEVGMAKSFIGDAIRRVMASGHQVHGAIGFTEEHDMSLYSRRSSMAAVNYGDSSHYRERIAQQMGL